VEAVRAEVDGGDAARRLEDLGHRRILQHGAARSEPAQGARRAFRRRAP
jgi:hypothetical protein